MNSRVAPIAAAALLTLAWPRVATATPHFPAVIQQFVGSAAPPPCTICHNSPTGGIGTVTTTFGKYMRSRGLLPLNDNSLNTALMAAQAEMHVSNGVGITDITALREGQDPNDPKAFSSGETTPPSFGCGAHIAPSTDTRMTPTMLLIVTALVVSRLRRLPRR